MKALLRIIRDDRAASAVEYGLMLALIVLAMVGGLTMFANSTIGMWNNVSSAVVTNG